MSRIKSCILDKLSSHSSADTVTPNSLAQASLRWLVFRILISKKYVMKSGALGFNHWYRETLSYKTPDLKTAKVMQMRKTQGRFRLQPKGWNKFIIYVKITVTAHTSLSPVHKHSVHQCWFEEVIVCYRGVNWYIWQSKAFCNLTHDLL